MKNRRHVELDVRHGVDLGDGETLTVEGPSCVVVWPPRPDFGPCIRPAGHDGAHIVHADVIEFE